MHKIRAVLFDADGTLWVGDNHVPGAAEAIDQLRENGVKSFVITNNSNNTRREIANKLKNRGFSQITPEMIVSAGFVVAQYILNLFRYFPNQTCSDLNNMVNSNNEISTTNNDYVNTNNDYTNTNNDHSNNNNNYNGFKVFVVGEKGLVEELKSHGINVLTVDDFKESIEVHKLQIDQSIKAVVAGADTTLSYRKFAIASRIVIENDALIIGTNCDTCDPVGDGILVPDAMPTIKFIECSTGRNAIVLGKPTREMYEPIRKMMNLEENEAMMVGDRLNTDIKFSHNIGAIGTLVLTGITKKEDAMAAVADEKPHHIVDSVANIPSLVLEINKAAALIEAVNDAAHNNEHSTENMLLGVAAKIGNTTNNNVEVM